MSVALVVDGGVELGVLYAPALDELWVAQKGQGALLNGETLHASQRTVFSGSRVPADALPKVDSDLVIVTKPNSIALRMALVADDRADLVATLRWGFEWDVAAAALIATEAGAAVTDAFGQPLVFNTPRAQAFGVIACAPESMPPSSTACMIARSLLHPDPDRRSTAPVTALRLTIGATHFSCACIPTA